jgi:hypothetical protein
MSVQGGNQSQYSHLQGTWTFAYTYTANGLSLFDLRTRWGATFDLLSDPQFQWTPSTALSPAQYALSGHLLNVQWPSLGPFVVQNFIDGQWQAMAGQGGQASIIGGVQLAPRACQTISIGGSVAVGLWPAGGGLLGRVDLQPTFSAALWF